MSEYTSKVQTYHIASFSQNFLYDTYPLKPIASVGCDTSIIFM